MSHPLYHFTIPIYNTAYTEHTEDPMEHGTTARFVVLLRVSSTKQGGDGNGIAAQRRDINLFLKQQVNPEVVAELVEVQSGASSKRPVLEQALDICKRERCSLLVQKVDRLTRDVETLGRLTKTKNLNIKIASLPNADNFQIHLYGILASQEREFISQRTRAAMAEAKLRGVQFGNPKLIQLNKERRGEAKKFAYEYADLIRNLRADNKTYRQICKFLNDSGIKTRTGSIFHPVHITRILARAK